MESNQSLGDCQIPCLRHLVEGPQESHRRSLQQVIRSYLGSRRSQVLEGHVNDMKNWYARLRGRSTKPVVQAAQTGSTKLKAGDPVRVRSAREIEATLDHSRRLKGCSFPPEMEQYCDTAQRVLKPVDRFVDERDYRVLRCRGVVLLDGLTCQGTAGIGRCDRNCYFFWREEWLERVDGPAA